MKTALLLSLLASFLIPGLAGYSIKVTRYQLQDPQSTVVKTQDKQHGVGSDELCKICIQFAVESLNILLNLILEGVVGECGDLCGALAEKTNKITGEICDVLCALFGIREFIKIIEEADLDPIYYCELLDQCGYNDNGDATITNATVTPKSGPRGHFIFPMTYVSKNGTSTGEVGIFVDTVDGVPVEDVELNMPQSPGTYNVEWNLRAEPDPDCDPTQGPCENWLPGLYNVTIAICAGECGSKHPHSFIYDEAHLVFEITG